MTSVTPDTAFGASAIDVDEEISVLTENQPAKTMTPKPRSRRTVSPAHIPVRNCISFAPSLFSQMAVEDLGSTFDHLKFLFADFKYFDTLVADKLKQAILHTTESGIDEQSCSSQTILDRYYQKDIFNTPERKLIMNQILIVFKTCYVFMISRLPMSLALRWRNVDQLLEHYPEFSEQNENELNLLLEFRNVMKIAMQIIPPDKNKNVLIKVAERLEGADNRYVTGGGQKPAVHRRVCIYLREGGDAICKPRPAKRILKVADASTDTPESAVPKKRKTIITSMKKLKLLRLSSDELKDLSKGPIDCFDDVDFSFLDVDLPPTASDATMFPAVDIAASDRLVDLMEFGSRNSHMKLGHAIDALCAPAHHSAPKSGGEPVRGSFSPPVGHLSVATAAKSKMKPRSVQRDVSSGWDKLPDAELNLPESSFLW